MPFLPDRQEILSRRLIYFSLGAFTLVQQTLLLREIFVVVSGNEFSFGITLANWLAGVFFGSSAGGLVADRIRRTGPAFASTVRLLCLTSPVMLSIARLIHLINSTPPGTSLPFIRIFLYSALTTIPFSFLVGFSFPLAARIGSAEDSPPSDRISRMYMTEALGGLAGGALCTFLLVERIDSFSIVALFSLPLLSLTLIPPARSGNPLMRGIGIALVVFNVLAVFHRLPGRWNDRLVQKRWRSISQLTLVEARESKVQNLLVGEGDGQFSVFGNGQLSAVFPDDDGNRILAAQLISQHPSPKRILVIGEAFSGIGAWLLKYPVERLESVEIDPMLVDLIRKNLDGEVRSMMADRRFRSVIGDGREYVRTMAGRIRRGTRAPEWDLVFIHAAEPSTALLNRCYTREFFSDIAATLRAGGVLALRVTASENYPSGIVGAYSASIYQTLQTVFPHVAVSPGTVDTFFASESRDSVTASPDVLARRYRRTGMEPAALADVFQSLYPAEKTRSAVSALQERPVAINSDERPISFFYYSKILGWYGGRSGGGLFEFFEKRDTGEALLFLIGITVLLLTAAGAGILSPAVLGRLAILYAAAAAGFSGLALEMTVIYSYQIRVGYAYRTVGMLIALFMFGLAVGAKVSSSWLVRSGQGGRGLCRLLKADLLLICVVSAAYPFFLRLLPGQRTFLSLAIPAAMILVGALVGAFFPLAVEGLLRSGADGGRAAGSVNALDHLGAALGAFLTAALFLPILGMVGSGMITGALAFSATGLLAAGFKSE